MQRIAIAIQRAASAWDLSISLSVTPLGTLATSFTEEATYLSKEALLKKEVTISVEENTATKAKLGRGLLAFVERLALPRSFSLRLP